MCSESELIRILEDVRPEIAFEELRPNDSDSVSTLETRAVRRYAETHTIKKVAVDSYVEATTLRKEFDAMWDHVYSFNEYCVIMEEMARMQGEQGFAYLNSPAFEELSNRSCAVRDWAVETFGDEDVDKGLRRWKDLMAQREEAMLENIYRYCRENAFSKGVFLVGAGHFSSMVKSIEVRTRVDPATVAWKLWNRT